MRGWIPWTAMAVASAMLGAGLWPAHTLRGALFAFAIVCVGGAFVNLLADRRRSRYDLAELHRVHERAELKEIEAGMPTEFGSVVCRVCGEVFPIGLPVCPRCRTSQYG